MHAYRDLDSPLLSGLYCRPYVSSLSNITQYHYHACYQFVCCMLCVVFSIFTYCRPLCFIYNIKYYPVPIAYFVIHVPSLPPCVYPNLVLMSIFRCHVWLLILLIIYLIDYYCGRFFYLPLCIKIFALRNPLFVLFVLVFVIFTAMHASYCTFVYIYVLDNPVSVPWSALWTRFNLHCHACYQFVCGMLCLVVFVFTYCRPFILLPCMLASVV